MASMQTFAQADLRGQAQDYKRDAARKHKWALGATDGAGRPRPNRPSETDYNFKRRHEKGAVASLIHGTKTSYKQDALDGTALTDDSSNSDECEELSASSYAAAVAPAADATITYSYDAARGPNEGSQILNVALARAVEKYEEAETTKLVRSEYEMVDSDGEPIAPSVVEKKQRRSKGKSKSKSKKMTPGAAVAGTNSDDAADEDYEFV